jgi:threonine/homoserine/homoserine lactone efflux protein
VFLSVAFSHSGVRTVYGRGQRVFECVAGAILAGFGVKLLFDGLR